MLSDVGADMLAARQTYKTSILFFSLSEQAVSITKAMGGQWVVSVQEGAVVLVQQGAAGGPSAAPILSHLLLSAVFFSATCAYLSSSLPTSLG